MPRLSQRVGNVRRGLERIRATINNHHRSNKNSYYLNLIRQSSRRCSKGLPYHRKPQSVACSLLHRSNFEGTAEDMVDLTERNENKLTSNQECQQQADLVIEGFKNLFEKCRAEQIYSTRTATQVYPPEGRLVKQTDPDNDLLVGLSSALPNSSSKLMRLWNYANLLIC
ncbi:hypothetical protein KEM48_001946 [Puccinia striiformis f. sp. tritici PST-130]|nr:hypothetical protein KEM48_001946 [Puccinia striiformis f. sp. tritici PST-130]